MNHHRWGKVGHSRLRVRLPVTCLTIFIAVSALGVGSAGAKSVTLGKSNKSNATTTIKSGNKKKVALAVSNTGGAPAASFGVKKNKTPFTVSSSTKVKNLNADLLDGLDSSRLQLRVGGICAAGSAIRVINTDGSVACQPVLTSTPPTPLPAWSLTGNANTNPNTNFLGTTDGQPLVVRTNNAERLRVTADGLVGVGTTTPIGLFQASANGAGQTALVASSANGEGINASSTAGNGLTASGATNGVSSTGINNGVFATSSGGIGVRGDSNARGVVGTLGGTSCAGTYAVGGCGTTVGDGVIGNSTNNNGVFGTSGGGIGVRGDSSARGVVGTLGGTSCAGIYAVGGCGATIGDGVRGNSTGGIGVRGDSTTDRGVVGTVNGGSCPGAPYGVGGCGGDGTGVNAISNNDGVLATSHHPSGGNTAAAVRAINNGGGDIFIGQNNATNHVARIDSSGKGFFDGGTQTGGADYAEAITAVNRAQLHPGDVLAIDPSRGYAVTRSGQANSQLAVGVYSTRPAMLAVGAGTATGALGDRVPVAMMGVVPTKVTAAGGAIRPGDLLTSSSVAGYAMRARSVRVHGIAIYPQGTIIGKALQSLPSGRGVIQVMLMSR